MRVISFGFHDVFEEGTAAGPGDAGHDPAYALSRRQLRNHLEAIRTRVGEQAVCTIDGVKVRIGPIPVFLTFDDGTLGAATCGAEELERLGWRGHFFVTTSWIGKSGFVDRQQIRALHELGHVIGSHSFSHPDWMSRLTWDGLLREWSDSCAALSDIVGQPVRAASVAGGDYSGKVGRAAAAAGIEVLFTSESTARSSARAGCLVLGRYSVRRFASASVVGAIAAGASWPWFGQASLWFAKKAAKRIAGRRYDDIRACVVSRLPRP